MYKVGIDEYNPSVVNEKSAIGRAKPTLSRKNGLSTRTNRNESGPSYTTSQVSSRTLPNVPEFWVILLHQEY